MEQAHLPGGSRLPPAEWEHSCCSAALLLSRLLVFFILIISVGEQWYGGIFILTSLMTWHKELFPWTFSLWSARTSHLFIIAVYLCNFLTDLWEVAADSGFEELSVCVTIPSPTFWRTLYLLGDVKSLIHIQPHLSIFSFMENSFVFY